METPPERADDGASSESRTLGAILVEAIDRRRRGEDPKPEEYTARHPELAEAIRSHFAMLELLEGRAADHGPSRQLLADAIAGMPQVVQDLILLRSVEGLSWSDLAKRLGAPADALQRRYAGALRSLIARCG